MPRSSNTYSRSVNKNRPTLPHGRGSDGKFRITTDAIRAPTGVPSGPGGVANYRLTRLTLQTDNLNDSCSGRLCAQQPLCCDRACGPVNGVGSNVLSQPAGGSLSGHLG